LGTERAIKTEADRSITSGPLVVKAH